jgi:uncharacterized protein (DUF433 family)
MSRGEKALLLRMVVQDLGDAHPGHRVRPPRVRRRAADRPTRIPVWVLERARRLGVGEADLLVAYPTLRAEDLGNAWAYVRSHRAEIDAQIVETRRRSRGALLRERELSGAGRTALRAMGHDATPTARCPTTRCSRSRGQQRAVLTLNRRHFVRLHSERPGHSGIVRVPSIPDFKRQARRIDAAVAPLPSLAGN